MASNYKDYTFVKRFGQLIFGPPKWWTGPPPKGSEIFVGRLPRDLYQNELMPVLESVGPVYEMRLMMDFSENTRGFAFARYTNKEDAEKAITILNDFEIRPGHRIGVLKSKDNCRLLIGNIPSDKTQEEVFKELSQWTEGVVKVTLKKSGEHNRVKSWMYAYVEYESHRAASMARRVLVSDATKPFGRIVSIDWEEPEPVPDEPSLNEVPVLYVRNVPINISECHLQDMFSINNTLKVQKVKKVKNFAFVHYYSRNDAENALNNLNGISISGQTIEVAWAKPPYSQRNVRYLKGRNEDIRGEQQYQLDNYSTCRPSTSSFFNPILLLESICLELGLGEPMYKISYCSSSLTGNCMNFTSQVFLPGSPFPLNPSVPPGKGFSSSQDAKLYAALCVLESIGYHHNTGLDTPTIPVFPSSNSPTPPALHSSNFPPPSALPSSTPGPPQNILSEHRAFNILEERSNKFSEPSAMPNASQNSVISYEDAYASFIERCESTSGLELLAAAAAVANIELQTNAKL